jgi:antirestriction protein ArdC
MGAEVGNLPGLGAFSHMGGSAFGATTHDAVHDSPHDAFMTLPPYTRTSEGEVHELGLGVRNGSHRARSDPLSEKSGSIERACEATSAEGTARCASRGYQ